MQFLRELICFGEFELGLREFLIKWGHSSCFLSSTRDYLPLCFYHELTQHKPSSEGRQMASVKQFMRSSFNIHGEWRIICPNSGLQGVVEKRKSHSHPLGRAGYVAFCNTTHHEEFLARERDSLNCWQEIEDKHFQKNFITWDFGNILMEKTGWEVSQNTVPCTLPSVNCVTWMLSNANANQLQHQHRVVDQLSLFSKPAKHRLEAGR
jgi:hypothetical protein